MLTFSALSKSENSFLNHMKPLEILFLQFKQFLANSGTVLNSIIIGLLVVSNLLKWITFGKLNPNEIDNLKDKIGYTLWEFWFGFFIFLKEIHSKKVDDNISLNSIIKWEFFKYSGLFFCIFLLKSFHFLLSARTYSLANTFNPKDQFKVKQFERLGLGILLTNCIDLLMIGCFLYQILYTYSEHHNNNSSLLFHDNVLIALFGFEIFHAYPLLCFTGLKFYFTYYQLKPKYLNIIEIGINITRLLMTGFFSIVFLYSYTLPFHILPSSYLSLRLLIIKIRCVISQELKSMDSKNIDISTDSKCIICFDDLINTTDGIQYLGSCDHNFHYSCLKGWLVHSNGCPVCRLTIEPGRSKRI